MDLPKKEVEFVSEENKDKGSAGLDAVLGYHVEPPKRLISYKGRRFLFVASEDSRSLTKKEMGDFLRLLREGACPSLYCVIKVKSGFDIDEGHDRPHDEKGRKVVDKFLRDNGWKSKVLTKKDWANGGRFALAGDPPVVLKVSRKAKKSKPNKI